MSPSVLKKTREVNPPAGRLGLGMPEIHKSPYRIRRDRRNYTKGEQT